MICDGLNELRREFEVICDGLNELRREFVGLHEMHSPSVGLSPLRRTTNANLATSSVCLDCKDAHIVNVNQLVTHNDVIVEVLGHFNHLVHSKTSRIVL